METDGFPPATRRDLLLDLVPALIDRYGDLSCDSAAEWYERMRAKWFTDDLRAVVAEPPGGDQLKNILRAKMGLLWKERGSGELELLRYLNQVVDRNVTEPAKRTVLLNAKRDPRKPRFARVPRGVTCEWCLMLASQGWVYASAEEAGMLDSFHAECDCEIVPEWEGRKGHVKGYDPEGMYERYQLCRETVERDIGQRYLTERKVIGTDGDRTYYESLGDFTQRAVLAEMRQRDRQWLYDGTVPEIEYQNKLARKELKPHEKLTIDILARNGFGICVPQRSPKDGVKTADIIINNVPVEMKAPAGNGKNTIDGLLRRAATQGKSAVIDLQIGRTEMDSKQCETDIRRSIERRDVEYVLFIDYDDSIKRIMKKAARESQ